MIISRLIGGLGNQMFQYAAGRRLAIIHNTDLKIDISGFGNYKIHRYQLGQYNISAQIATTDEIKNFRGKSILFINRLTPSNARWIKEKYFHFDPSILMLQDNVYLDGYWQSEKYFKDVENPIRHDLRVKSPPSENNASMLTDIQRQMSVALHIRRGDYVTNKITNLHHGTATLEYYQNAIKYLISHGIQKPCFYIFSDDPTWVKQNLKLDYPTVYVNHNDRDHGYEDMNLMSHCQHFIIANSTFSWWGAWLSNNPNKIVIAPKLWFADPMIDTNDLIPSEWRRL